MSTSTENTPLTLEESEAIFIESFDKLVAQLEDVHKVTKTALQNLKNIKKEHTKLIKKATGLRRKKVQKDPNVPKKPPTGFVKPSKVSDELSDFLGLPRGELLSRPSAASKITEYADKHGLKNPNNGHEFDLTKPGGEELAKLFRITNDKTVSFYNLQTYLKLHFPLSVKAIKEKENADKADKVDKVDKADEQSPETIKTKSKVVRKPKA